MIFFSNIKNGKLQDNVRKQIAEFISSCKDARYQIEIKLSKKTRSSEQNAFIHLLFTILSQELIIYTGDKEYTPAAVKSICKTKFLKVPMLIKDEIIGERIKGTSELSTTEMSVFMADIIQWSAEQFGINLPLPNEQVKAFK